MRLIIRILLSALAFTTVLPMIHGFSFHGSFLNALGISITRCKGPVPKVKAARVRHAGQKIDVVLLDMTMPGASCHEIVAETVNAKPDIKVIFTSAYSQEMIASSISAPQIHSFIRKPFQFGDLLKTLRNSLSS